MITVDAELMKASKRARRIKTDVYDSQIEDLLNAALLDLGVAGVVLPDQMDSLIKQAAITYVLLHFGEPDNYDRYKASYDEQKAQLATCTGYTDWGD
jgi:hypothetical protein